MGTKPAVTTEPDEGALLLEAVARADAQAMADLMLAHGRWIRGIILSAGVAPGDLDDVLQHVWLMVWREARHLQDVTRWRGWVCSIARNSAADFLRRQGRRRRGILAWLRIRRHQAAGRPAGLPETVDARDELQTVLEAIRSLPTIYREPFVLRHLEDWSYHEIGRTLGLPADTVETRLVRARRLLRSRLEGKVSGHARRAYRASDQSQT